MAAIVETVLAVSLFWWFAINYYGLSTLLFSALVAPLVLLRSQKSMALSTKWFMAWEQKVWRDVRPDADWSKREARVRFVAALALGVVGGLSTILWRKSAFEGPGYWVFTMGLITALCSITVATTPIVLFDGNLKRHGASAAKLAAITACMVSGLISMSKSEPVAFLGALLASVARLTYTDYGQVLGLMLLAKAMTIAAALKNITQGLKALPDNFRRLVFCTDIKTTPELMPGLPVGATEFTLTDIRRHHRALKNSTSPGERHYARLLYYPLYALFLPSLIYRFTLKSTAWFWWPLALIAKPPVRANNPEWFHDEIKKAIFSWISLSASLIIIILFIWQNVVSKFIKTGLPDNPFITIVGYFFLVEWAAPPWQLLGLFGAVVSLTVLVWIDWSYKKRAAAERTGDAKLYAESDWHFVWIERVARLRTITLVIYLILVAIQAGLYFNHQSCWLKMPEKIIQWSEILYGARGTVARPGPTCDTRPTLGRL